MSENQGWGPQDFGGDTGKSCGGVECSSFISTKLEYLGLSRVRCGRTEGRQCIRHSHSEEQAAASPGSTRVGGGLCVRFSRRQQPPLEPEGTI